MFLKFLPFETSSVWKLPDPDTGRMHEAESREKLIQQIVSYRSQNRLPTVEKLGEVIENYLCSLPINIGKCMKAPPLKRGFVQALKGGLLLIEKLWYDKTVPQQVADSRAKVCVSCPYNVFADKGPFIKWADMIAENSVGDKKSMYHNELGNCSVCSCPLRAKVFYDGDMGLTQEQKAQMKEVNCWQVK